MSGEGGNNLAGPSPSSDWDPDGDWDSDLMEADQVYESVRRLCFPAKRPAAKAAAASQKTAKRPKLSVIKANGYTLSLETEDELGRGTYGRVVRGWKGSKRPGTGKAGIVAVKLVTVGTSNETKVQREVDLLRKLSHPNIVKLRDSFKFSKGMEQYFALVMSAAESTLEKSLPLPGNYDRFLCMLQLVNAVTWLHSKNVMHRDIKPANILRFRISASEGPDPAVSTVWRLADFYVVNPVT